MPAAAASTCIIVGTCRICYDPDLTEVGLPKLRELDAQPSDARNIEWELANLILFGRRFVSVPAPQTSYGSDMAACVSALLSASRKAEDDGGVAAVCCMPGSGSQGSKRSRVKPCRG